MGRRLRGLEWEEVKRVRVGRRLRGMEREEVKRVGMGGGQEG